MRHAHFLPTTPEFLGLLYTPDQKLEVLEAWVFSRTFVEFCELLDVYNNVQHGRIDAWDYLENLHPNIKEI